MYQHHMIQIKKETANIYRNTEVSNNANIADCVCLRKPRIEQWKRVDSDIPKEMRPLQINVGLVTIF